MVTAKAPPASTGQLYIDAGASVSTTLDIGSKNPFIIVTPAQWTPANLTFEISIDGAIFYPLYIDGALVIVACPPKSAILLTAASGNYPNGTLIRFISGTPDNQIPQLETRQFQVIS
jgi:hypothetical protein